MRAREHAFYLVFLTALTPFKSPVPDTQCRVGDVTRDGRHRLRGRYKRKQLPSDNFPANQRHHGPHGGKRVDFCVKYLDVIFVNGRFHTVKISEVS